MADKIRVRRGLKKDLPSLEAGEYGLSLDTKEIYIGTDSGNLHINKTNSFFIDLNTYHITEGIPKKPYTEQDYTNALNNMIGMNRAIEYAYNNGYSEVILPRGDYSAVYTDSAIKLKSYITLNLDGSRIKVLFDSENNDLYRGLSELIVFNNAHHAHVKNGEIMGDKYDRSFIDASEKLVENTYGVCFKQGSSYCSLSHVKVHGFMGDPVNFTAGGWSRGGYTTGSTSGSINIDTGELEPNPQADTVYTNKVSIPDHYFDVFTLGGQGYSRTTNLKHKRFDVFFYENDHYLGVLKGRKVQAHVSIPMKATHFRFKFYNEIDTSKNFQIFINWGGDCHHNVVQYNEIFNGHRGGITLGGSYNIIQYNTIRDNGKFSNTFLDGAPTFPDTTRYAINQEDSFGDNNMIRHNNIYGSWHGILVGAYSTMIENNIISNVDSFAIVLYSIEYAKLSGNYIQGGGVYLFGGGLPGRVEIIGNHLKEFSNKTNDYDAIVSHNHFDSPSNLHVGNAVFESNTVEVGNNHTGISGGTRMKNNIFYSKNRDNIRLYNDVADVMQYNQFEGVDIDVSVGNNKSIIFKDSTFTNCNIITTASASNVHVNIESCELKDTLITPRSSSKTTIHKCYLEMSPESSYDSFIYSFNPNEEDTQQINIIDSTVNIGKSIKEIIKYNYIYKDKSNVTFKRNKIKYTGEEGSLTLKLFVEDRIFKATIADNTLINTKFTALTHHDKYTLYDPDTSYEDQISLLRRDGVYKGLITHNLKCKYPYIVVTDNNGFVLQVNVKIIDENQLEIIGDTEIDIHVFMKVI